MVKRRKRSRSKSQAEDDMLELEAPSPKRDGPPPRWSLQKEFAQDFAAEEMEKASELMKGVAIPKEVPDQMPQKETVHSKKEKQAENQLIPPKQTVSKGRVAGTKWFVTITDNLARLVQAFRQDGWNQLCTIMDSPVMSSSEDGRRKRRLAFIQQYSTEVGTFEAYFTRARRNGLFTMLTAFREECNGPISALETELRLAMMLLDTANASGIATYSEDANVKLEGEGRKRGSDGGQRDFDINHNSMMKTVIVDFRTFFNFILETIDDSYDGHFDVIPDHLSKMLTNILFHCESQQTSSDLLQG